MRDENLVDVELRHEDGDELTEDQQIGEC